MADEIKTEIETPTPTQSELLQAAAFGDEQQQTQIADKKEEQKIDAPVVKDIEVPKEWLKKEFDVDDFNVIKAEREELKKLKETPPTAAEIKFANDQSKQIHELIREGKTKEVKKFLETQEQLESLTSLEVSKDNAENILKLQIKLNNPTLTPQEVDFRYKQNYVPSREPIQRASETDEEFEERTNEWKEQVANIDMKKVIDAKVAQPELAKLKTEIVLPEIQKKENLEAAKPSQKDLDDFAKTKNSFLESAEKATSAFNGFSAQVKDKDVDYNVGYTPSQDEKTLISNKLKQFAEAGLNTNSLFADRWLNEDDTINVIQMTEDLSRIYMGKNSDQKIANDAANKRLEAYLKDKKQINVNEQRQEGIFSPANEKTAMDNVREQAFA